MHRDGELVSQPRQTEPRPTAWPQSPASACHQATHVKPGVASPAPGSSRRQGPASARGVNLWDSGGCNMGNVAVVCFCCTPCLPATPPRGAPSAPVLQACWRPVTSYHLLTPFWELAPSSHCFACVSFLGRMTSLPEREHSCEIQGSWAQVLHCFILIVKVMWDPCRISPEMSRSIHASRRESSAQGPAAFSPPDRRCASGSGTGRAGQRCPGAQVPSEEC